MKWVAGLIIGLTILFCVVIPALTWTRNTVHGFKAKVAKVSKTNAQKPGGFTLVSFEGDNSSGFTLLNFGGSNSQSKEKMNTQNKEPKQFTLKRGRAVKIPVSGPTSWLGDGPCLVRAFRGSTIVRNNQTNQDGWAEDGPGVDFGSGITAMEFFLWPGFKNPEVHYIRVR